MTTQIISDGSFEQVTGRCFDSVLAVICSGCRWPWCQDSCTGSAEYSTHVHANESLCSALLCMYYESLTFSHQSASLSKHSKPEIPIIGLCCMLSKERLDTELTEAENWPTLCWCLPLHEYGNKLEVFLVLVLFKVFESVNWLFHLVLQARRFDFRSVTWFDLLEVV